MQKQLELRYLSADFLIIGGGTAGCYAALEFCRASDGNVIIIEKANIRRSGCLAAGVNAINAYINPGSTPEGYAAYAARDAEGIASHDILLSMARGLNDTVKRMEELGLSVLKDEFGRYSARGAWNIKINGENIKPLLAKAVAAESRIAVFNHVWAKDFIVKEGRAVGAYAVDLKNSILYAVSAKAVLCATGGAAGLYKPNAPGFSRHKMWYPPFNSGTGYAMGLRAGAEMTSFEMRFIALRCKGTLAPTGTLAQGVGAKQINALGEECEGKYGRTTSQRLFAAKQEESEGRGPCFLKTTGISKEQDEDLFKAYLNMAPSQTLKWVESGKPPSEADVEIEGSEPYIIGGHTGSGYWVDNSRQSTIASLYAAGDASGACPQKYVSGAFAEGAIAARSAAKLLGSAPEISASSAQEEKEKLNAFFGRKDPGYTARQLEERMQCAMDKHAGGIGSNYRYSGKSLAAAEAEILEIESLSSFLRAETGKDLAAIHELRDRLLVCRALISHLGARKETRWRLFAEHADYPLKDDGWLKFVNSVLRGDKIEIIIRDVEKEGSPDEH
ncbi:MAG: adenylyl-sulfate reductase subunit alpha [Clostridiales bacterium]|nr:adenylyl-sulfate reductase subunit alpha [Clostridiales bacterium]